MRNAYVPLQILIASFFAIDTYAQSMEPSDSLRTSKELEEVVVVGQNQRAEAGELVFTPTARQKQAAQDGYELLRHLAIPQISVDYAADRVTTVTGGDVALFINGFHAEPYEVKTLKTTDVLRVDYLDFPSDPKFGVNSMW